MVESFYFSFIRESFSDGEIFKWKSKGHANHRKIREKTIQDRVTISGEALRQEEIDMC